MYNSILDDFKNAWNKPNNAPAQLIIINVIAFAAINILKVILYFAQSESIYFLIREFLTLPSSFTGVLTKPWTLVTYMFLHEGIGHIFFNMIIFYPFARLVQEFLNSKRVISLYILGGLSGGVLYILIYNVFPQFETVVANATLLGASASVLAIVVGGAVFMPNYTFFLMFIGPIRIKYIAMVFVFISFIQTIGSNAGGEIAHLGGALMGWLFISQLKNGTDLGAWVIAVMNWFKSFFVASPKIKVTHRTPPKNTKARTTSKSTTSHSKTEQEEIDAILDKISQSGYDSLTKEEKQKLFNASKN